ncbi:hypothetical protein F5884DRAFT_764693 [Xylogone sp. PMI_703]|nr:hypothetical protein F5884DRAFT_764693 [Xylogone sp. PMI_703]
MSVIYISDSESDGDYGERASFSPSASTPPPLIPDRTPSSNGSDASPHSGYAATPTRKLGRTQYFDIPVDISQDQEDYEADVYGTGDVNVKLNPAKVKRAAEYYQAPFNSIKSQQRGHTPAENCDESRPRGHGKIFDNVQLDDLTAGLRKISLGNDGRQKRTPIPSPTRTTKPAARTRKDESLSSNDAGSESKREQTRHELIPRKASTPCTPTSDTQASGMGVDIPRPATPPLKSIPGSYVDTPAFTRSEPILAAKVPNKRKVRAGPVRSTSNVTGGDRTSSSRIAKTSRSPPSSTNQRVGERSTESGPKTNTPQDKVSDTPDSTPSSTRSSPDPPKSSNRTRKSFTKEVKPPEFTNYYEYEDTPHQVEVSIINFLKTRHSKNLPSKALQKSARAEGYIYIFTSLLTPGHYKIGRTKQAPRARVAQWDKCRLNPIQISDDKDKYFALYYLVEELIQIELHNERRKYTCGECRRQHRQHERKNVPFQAMTGKKENSEHGEWYCISEKRALHLVNRWRDWIRNFDPYSADMTLRDRWAWKLGRANGSLEPVDWDKWTKWDNVDEVLFQLDYFHSIPKAIVPDLMELVRKYPIQVLFMAMLVILKYIYGIGILYSTIGMYVVWIWFKGK